MELAVNLKMLLIVMGDFDGMSDFLKIISTYFELFACHALQNCDPLIR